MKKLNLNTKKTIGIVLAIFFIAAVFLKLTINTAPLFPNAKLTSEKKIFKAYEVPTFKLQLNEKETTSIIKNVFAEGEPNVKAEFTFFYS